MPTELRGRAPSHERERDLGLDLIRALAAFLVVSVHFFLNCGFYELPMVGKRMLLMTVVRTGLMVCVPLFLLLTGCLCRNKKLSGRYYLGLLRVLLTYVLASAVCMGFRCLYIGDVDFSLGWAADQLLTYLGAPYAWYVEMYIGLFLLIPFLNALYHGLESRRQKELLILTLLALTTLPALANAVRKILPEWWLRLYPVAYYFLGAYLGEYRPKVRWRWGLPVLAAAVLAGGAQTWLSNRGGWTDLNNWYDPGVLIAAALVFLLARKLPTERLPDWCKWLIRKGAELSLGIYLVSWCFDQLFYPVLAAHVPEPLNRLVWLPVMAPAVYVCSALAAQAVEWARRGITWGLGKLFPALR